MQHSHWWLFTIILVFLSACATSSRQLREELLKAARKDGIALGTVETIFGSPSSLKILSPDGNTVADWKLSSVFFNARFVGGGKLIVASNVMPSRTASGAYPIVVLSLQGELKTQAKESFIAVHSLSYSQSTNMVSVSGTYRRPNGTSATGLHLIDLSGKKPLRTILVFTEDDSYKGYADDLSWSPEGSSLVYERNSTIWIYDLLSNHHRVLTAGDNCEWSPNGAWIVYRTLTSELALVDPDGYNMRSLISKISGSPRWSPSGDYLLIGLPWGLLRGTHMAIYRVRDGAVAPVQSAWKGFGSEWGWVQSDRIAVKSSQ